ncbi:MAG: MogA/MoaB family molybdenum cofactor biosynthesis protein [Clostridiaceae bacterium]|nr:MogA/MoaB family molybdenum cofactor biosynthesis protein [Clostridiaceae bacterium]
MLRVGVLTVSDKGSSGEREDRSGTLIQELLCDAGHETVWYGIVPDDREMIVEKLRFLCDSLQSDIVLTTGGTGLSPRDVTPEATLQIAERQVPGIAESIRMQSMQKTPRAMLSRGVAVTRGGTLVINFPGSPKAVAECMEIVLPVLEHASGILKGKAGECGTAVE